MIKESNFQLLKKLIEQNYQKTRSEIPATQSRKELKLNRRLKILDYFLKNYSEKGFSQSELMQVFKTETDNNNELFESELSHKNANKTRLKNIKKNFEIDERTLERELYELEKEGWIKKGKFSKYHLMIPDSTLNYLVKAETWKKTFPLLVFIKENLIQENRFFKKKPMITDENGLDNYLLELVNRIGFVIVFLFIYSMNPLNKIVEDDYYEDKDTVILDWLNDIMSYVIKIWLEGFRENIYDFLYEFFARKTANRIFKDKTSDIFSNEELKLLEDEGAKDMFKSLMARPKFSLDNGIIDLLLHSLKRVFPEFSNLTLQLETNFSEYENKEMNEIKYLSYCVKTRKKCEHDWFLYIENNSRKFEHCKRCHFSKRTN
jgi:hypothetical protein